MCKVAFALRALNVETTRAMDIASDPRIGLMHLLWWQQTIDNIYANKLIENPTARLLPHLYLRVKLASPVSNSVEARIKDAQRDVTDIPQTIAELETYAEDIVSTLLYMTLQAGGIRSTTADHAASLVGKASGLLFLLRALSYHVSQNRYFAYVPIEVAAKNVLLVKEGGQQEIRINSCDALCDAVFEMESVANVHLQKARELNSTVQAEARAALLPAVPPQVLLDSLNRVQFDVFDPRLAKGVLGILHCGTSLN